MDHVGVTFCKRLIASFTTLEDLRRWWDCDAGMDAKMHPDVVAAKEQRKAELT
ncbi:hypothetical protein [Pseudosulfitobacter pseudonitzschiae]|uniref:hypothetical protein n=1 Tax=Pseudosulfitobacter pseudonitzschiae TaxID=1402135 RepID=UPI001AF07EE5|nr:hypothetical protein [Pseudosulfitobacter pseudonitzschiae]MBM1817190.1 hypothetical protein [Pseudosulfitobacter pseudonitzschiae]MBM1834201.1 hypothetical protein [Pseudosulfitobacter pseudonitzschiae]MBM1839066.1 hypothetical protein [Pseudosulfitobacter pseudonitzschiae]MBM1843914.1 hypothetical protein [Pseudosulfitobacter pseudonitzschiae]MBM1848751.1 hypothetical protein [Pseudosulfitobacter pseudonitzschiae]